MYLYDRSIKPICVLAAVLWITGWLSVLGNLVWPIDGLAGLGLGLMATAAVLQIRGYYLSLRKRFDDHQLAFEMGKEVAQQARPRSVR
jgi:hypothetical protein